ncbi:MAG: sporulation protein YunB [Bacilli bacterium]
MGRIRLKKKHLLSFKSFKISGIHFFIIIFILFVGTLYITFSYINNKITPTLINYAEIELKRFSNLVINRAVNDVITEDLKVDELLIIGKDNNDEIKTIDFNPIFVNRLLTIITSSVQKNLKNIVKGNLDKVDIIDENFDDYDLEKLKNGIIFEIPSGIIAKNALLSNLGPKVPVRFNLVGEVISRINTNITNYGINNAMIEISIDIELNEQVILPFVSKKIIYNTSIPIAIKLIQGTVPNYYFNGLNKSSPNVLVPVE